MKARSVSWYLAILNFVPGLAAASCKAIVDFGDLEFTREPCTRPSDCGIPAPCRRFSCNNGGCVENIAEGLSCGDTRDFVCNAAGDCVQCIQGSDCPSGVCIDDACQCDDGMKNGDETGIDCGGLRCSPCSAGTTCIADRDCLGKVCHMGVCDACGDAEWAQWQPSANDWVVLTNAVRDKHTGLTWTRETVAGKTWFEAQAHCQGQWRLPTRIELSTLVDYKKSSPSIDTSVFTDMSTFAPQGFWTATENAANKDQAWFISFFEGHVDISDKLSLLAVRCVRP